MFVQDLSQCLHARLAGFVTADDLDPVKSAGLPYLKLRVEDRQAVLIVCALLQPIPEGAFVAMSDGDMNQVDRPPDSL